MYHVLQIKSINAYPQGEPYLHIDGDMLVVPGATKYTARVLVFDSQEGTLKRVRDLVHRKLWLLSAVIGKIE